MWRTSPGSWVVRPHWKPRKNWGTPRRPKNTREPSDRSDMVTIWGYPEVILRLYHDIPWYTMIYRLSCYGYHMATTIWGYIIRLCLKCLSESRGPDHARGLSIVVRFRVPPGISRWELATKKCLQLGIWFVMRRVRRGAAPLCGDALNVFLLHAMPPRQDVLDLAGQKRCEVGRPWDVHGNHGISGLWDLFVDSLVSCFEYLNPFESIWINLNPTTMALDHWQRSAAVPWCRGAVPQWAVLHSLQQWPSLSFCWVSAEFRRIFRRFFPPLCLATSSEGRGEEFEAVQSLACPKCQKTTSVRSNTSQQVAAHNMWILHHISSYLIIFHHISWFQWFFKSSNPQI